MKATTTSSADTHGEAARETSAWDEVRFRFEHRRDEILERIGGYPTPIPACDVDFNRMLEERARVFEELDRLATLRERDSDGRDNPVVAEFIASCTSLSEDDRRALRALLKK